MLSTTKNAIRQVIENYFKGSYEADEIKLRQAFHPKAHITGNFDGQYVDFSLKGFIERVSKANAKANQEQYDKKILDMEIQNDIAVVKAKVKVGDVYCIDLISLINIEGSWVIRHKIFTNQVK